MEHFKLKFRFWCNGKMVYCEPELWVDYLSKFFIEYDDVIRKGFFPYLMQSTGLKDCEGKEVYESDVLETEDGGLRVVVSFKDGCFGFYNVSRIKILTNFFNIATDIDFENLKIIGNKFQAPELLNPKKTNQPKK